MAHYEFEPVIPVEHVMDLITLVRQNTDNLLSVKGDILVEIGCITGELGAYLGPKDIPMPMGSGTEPATLEEACSAVESAMPEGMAAVGSVDILMIIQIINLIRKILTELL